MAKFLHVADVHLGFDRYDSRDRTRDFFLAFRDVLQRYAIDEAVDFVVIAGDLFEHRTIQPATLNQAQLCLQQLKEANIPVLAIEGNHDNRPYGTRTSWLKYLSEWELLKLLEPGDIAAGEPFYSPWDADSRRGGYLDLDCGVRVLGSNWYGSAAPKAIEQVAAEIAALPSGPAHTLLLFHHGLEGQIARYAGALRYSDLLPLRQAGVEYLALGHIHKQYTMENWIFNPGSIEANNVEEAGYQRGAYLVELTAQGVQATLKTDYYQRPIVRLSLTLRGQESQDQVVEAAVEAVEAAIAAGQIVPSTAPMVELRIQGQAGFERLELDLRQLQGQLQQHSGALVFLLKYEAEAVAYSTPMPEQANRSQIEQTIFTDLLAAHRDYKGRADALARGLMDLKDQQLAGASEPELYQLVETLLAEAEPAP
jgi:DNA repair protein SbcD/Mre11